MANPRRGLIENQSLSPLMHLLKKPHAFPLLLFLFILLTWISLRIQHSSHFPSLSSQQKSIQYSKGGGDDDEKANLVRFEAASPSLIRKDERGWLLNPVSLARDSRIKGGALSCVSVHLGEIRPGGKRGNHRHYTCNETFVIWGAKTKFRVENHKVDKGFAEVVIGEGEVAVAASPSGTAHALVNIDPLRSTFFIGCQDNMMQHNSSTTDFNVWKDL